jgi:hypothetical protein
MESGAHRANIRNIMKLVAKPVDNINSINTDAICERLHGTDMNKNRAQPWNCLNMLMYLLK